MNSFKILIEYDGTRYSGWQEQKNSRTVMGEIRKAAREVFGSDVEMQGAGRTDAGVHALGQVLHIKVASRVMQPPRTIQQRLNDLLPVDIAVLDIEPRAAIFMRAMTLVPAFMFTRFRSASRRS